MTPFHARPDASDYAPYYGMYVTRVPDGDLRDLLLGQIDQVRLAIGDYGGKYEDFAYAPGKWTVRELFQHVNDTERVMGSRLVRFIRRDPTPLPGFDQDLFIENGRSDTRSLVALVEEFEWLRRANVALVRELTADDLAYRGTMWEKQLSVLSLTLLLHGHAGHHLDVLRDRYRPEA